MEYELQIGADTYYIEYSGRTEGKYYPATRFEPAEYPEIYIEIERIQKNDGDMLAAKDHPDRELVTEFFLNGDGGKHYKECEERYTEV